MKTICLFGIGNSGKTRTLGLLAKSIDADSQSKLEEGNTPIGHKDFYAVFKYRGCRVGIGSEGDTPNQVKRNLTRLMKFKCDIIIVAARSRGGTHDAIYKICKKSEITWLRQRDVWRNLGRVELGKEKLMETSNAQTAELLSSIVDDFVA